VIVFISSQAESQNLIQATLKMGDASNKVDVWLKPNFTNNNVQYLFQIGLPIAWPANAPIQPVNINYVLDPGFISTFGNNNPANYTVSLNPVATSTGGFEKYINIVMVRLGPGASNPQSWTSGVEFKVLTVVFDNPVGSPGSKVKLADYQDGGSDGQGNFYTQDAVGNYYVTTNSVGNFYSSGTESISGGNNNAGFVQTSSVIPSSCTVPSSLSASSVTNNSASITWNLVPGATGYEYVVSASSILPVSGTAIATNSYNANSLNSGTPYYVFVRTNCGGGNFSNWATTSFNTAATACNAPSTPIAGNIGITTADITWGAVSGAIGYEYILSTSSFTPASPSGTGTATPGTTYNASALIGGTHYYFFVRTNCGSGNFSPWVSADFNTQPPLCSAPSVPTISGITTTSADINWNAVSGSSGYEYVISTSTGIPAGSGTAISSTSLSSTGLTSGTAYYVFVRNNCGGGLYSSWAMSSFNTLCPTPASVTVPVATITSSSAIITWNSTGATSYQYDISTSLAATTSTPSTGGTTTAATTFSATGLAPGTNYYAHIRSICSANNFSEWMVVPFTTICTVPGPITVGNISPTSGNISWGAVPEIGSYEYAVSINPNSPASGTPTIFNTIPLSNLTPGTQYYVFVRTKCNPGVNSGWINTSFTTTFPPCNAPTSINLSNINDKIDFNWPAVSGAVGYEYLVSTSATSPTINGIFTSLLSASSSNLNSNTLYYVYVRAYCGPGRYSGWIFKTFTTTCYKPVIYFVRNLPTLGSADLAWHSVRGALKYEYAILNNAAPPSGSINFITDTLIHTIGLVPGNKYYLHVRAHCSATSLSEWSTQEFYASGLALYPNSPNVFTIIFYGTEIQNGEIALFDGSGKIIKTIKQTALIMDIDLNSFASGIYYIRYGKNNQYVKKIIKL
jgi:hypothetical protein